MELQVNGRSGRAKHREQRLIELTRGGRYADEKYEQRGINRSWTQVIEDQRAPEPVKALPAHQPDIDQGLAEIEREIY